jgi:sugar transferase (PEP-CTERM/EpsH1 system associated)
MQDLLFLSHRIPYPPDKGEKIRAWHMFRHLARSFRIHLGCFVDDPDDAARVPELRSLCADLMCIPLDQRTQRLKALLRARPGQPLTLGYFHDPRLQLWVDTALARNRIQHIFVCSSAMAHYVMHATAPVRILDMVDVDSAKWTSYAAGSRWPSRMIYAREGRTLLAFERRAARAFTHSLFVSEAEWRHFVALAPETRDRTGWVDNGVDLDYFAPRNDFADPFPPAAPHGSPRLVFTGRMDYRPNIDAVTWFAEQVMPPLRASYPDASFAIVGSAPSPQVRALAAHPGVIVTGRVADTRPWLAHAAIVVAPLLIARGTQNKVLEGMAMARPVIATPEAFEGVQASPEQDILLASGVDQTIARITEVLSGCHPGLGQAARQAMKSRHDWNATLARLDTLFANDDSHGGPAAASDCPPGLPSSGAAQ